jgi:predicted AlkP superfamily phosphohydrolase/phosphomutase/Tfp pilus assembly protein PilF
MREVLRRSLAAAGLAVLLASCRREAAPAAAAAPSRTPAPAPAVPSDAQDVATRTRRGPGGQTPVIWLGLDGLDFELVDRLAAEGKMPNWKRLEAEGYTARLTSYQPILSPIVWTTLATGLPPDRHRVLDFQEVDPASGQKMPISGRSRAVPAIWNVATSAGLSVGVVGWWATHPAEEVRGFFVSDHASAILFQGLSQRGVAYPESLSSGVARLMETDGHVSDEELTAYVDMPVAEITRERRTLEPLQNPVTALGRTIGATRLVAHVARELYDRNLPDLTMVYFEGTDVIGHVFAPDEPPQMPCTSDEDFKRYGRAVDTYFALVDRILGQWMRRAEEDGATLLVNSDHGFRWGSDRSCQKGSRDPGTAGWWHRLDGVFAAWGTRVRPSPRRGHHTVYDVDPTVSALLGLPVDVDARGELMRDAFSALPNPRREKLSETVPVRRLESASVSESEAADYAKKLRALGYLSGNEPSRLAPSGEDRPGLTESGWNNLGLFLSAKRSGDSDRAEEAAYRKAVELDPSYSTPKYNLAVMYRRRGDDRQAIDWLFRALESGAPDPDGNVLAWAFDYVHGKKAREARDVLERGASAFPDSEAIQRALALDLYSHKECARADRQLARFETPTRGTETLNALALIRACLGRRQEAVDLFRRSLALEPKQEAVVRSLAMLEGGATGTAARTP